MAFIRKVKTTSGATAVQIAQKEHGRIVRIDHIGSAHTKEDLETLLALAKKRLLGGQQPLFAESPPLKVHLRQSVSRLLLEVLTEQYNYLGFNQLGDDVFSYLCAARIVEPTSKLDSIRVLGELGVTGLSKNRLYRCLGQMITKDYRSTLANLCFVHAASEITLVLYDVTSLYFEVQEEDDYRKSGMSKERRLEPQIIVGLLVDQNGFPLGLHSFEGNTAETNTILPVIEEFKKQHKLSNITVVADAGMLSRKNLEALESAGYTYVVGSRLQKIPYDIAAYQKSGTPLTDLQIITTQLSTAQRIIYQYREKRAALDLRNIEKQIAKARHIINGNLTGKKAKFLSMKVKEKKLNQPLIDKAKSLAGIKGYVTNLQVSDEQIITFYHQLWHVEQSFRMSKSDLKARPIFHHKREAIEAHLTIVLAALAIGKLIENNTGMSIKRFVRTLRPIRSGVVLINSKEYEAEAEISTEVKSLIRKLRSGH